jgi:hypothetical protein
MIQLRFAMALGAALTGAAFAQVVVHTPGIESHEIHIEQGGMISASDFAFVKAEFSSEGKVVTGSPYSAQAVTEFTQVLADGNRISRTNSAFIARDSSGRTRREQSLMAIGPWSNGSGDAPKSVFIQDPVAGVTYMLEPNSHVANMMHQQQRLPVENLAREKELRAKKEAERIVRPMPFGKEPSVKKESLGSQVINGVMADGTRITRTIPAGQIGNDRPIDTVTESWYSQELQTVVMSKTTDPRTGDTVYKLTNIDRAEPSAALFTVPSDYTIHEGKGAVFNYEIRRKE